MGRECWDQFSPPPLISDPNMHHGTCVTHVPGCMPGSLISCFLWSQWRGKRSRHSRCMRNPQFYVSSKRPIQSQAVTTLPTAGSLSIGIVGIHLMKSWSYFKSVSIIKVISRGVSGLATDSPCSVWGRGLTTCLLHDNPLFGSHFKMRVGMLICSDISYIYHYFLPRSVHGFMQETSDFFTL